MEGFLAILVFPAVIAVVIVLFMFADSFAQRHNRSCIHLPHVIILILFVFSMGIPSKGAEIFRIFCWIALAGVFVYYVKQYGLLSAIGIWLYNTLLFILIFGTILQLTGSRKKR